jgi:hypothetical protein
VIEVVHHRDLWIATVTSIAAATALSLALRVAPLENSGPQTPRVATVSQASGEGRLRPARMLGWLRLARGSDVHDGDAVFVAPGGDATLSFDDGTELFLDERSLVVVEPPRAGMRFVTLRQGALTGRVGPSGLTLNTPVGEAQLDSSSEARVELSDKSVEVSVKKGSARVKSKRGAGKKITGGQRAESREDGAISLPAWPVQLAAPEANWRQAYKGRPGALQLSWGGELPKGARVQVAHDRMFAFAEREFPAESGSAMLEAPSPGITWWRVVDARRLPVSESRRFLFVEDAVPHTIMPRAGDVLLAPPGTHVFFGWAPLPGISRYRLEISPSQGFEPITQSEVATGSELRLPLRLDEGTWYWRIRADDTVFGVGTPSAPAKLRIIHRGIPEAPELFNPEIEVTP